MLDSFFESLAGAAGAPPDYVRLIFLLLVSSPLAYPLPWLPPLAKHLACIGISATFFLGILNLRFGFAQLLGTSLFTYAAARFQLGGKNMPWIVFAVEMAHLTVNHCVRAFGNIPLTTIEITAMQMVLTMNLTTFAWDVYDGQMRTEEQCDDQQKKDRVTEMPNVIEFLGYCFFFPGVLIGPSTRFSDYRAWANGTLYASPKGKEKANGGTQPQQPPPGRVRNALQQFGIGAFSLGVFAVFAPGWDFTSLLKNSYEGGVRDAPFFYRVFFAMMASFMARTKYYGIWTLTNAACMLSGLAYNGLAPADSSSQTLETRTRWDRCQNVDILGVELAQNWKELLDHWNMNTNVWLRNNVYKRVARPGKKPGFKSTMMTFITSAFWHGIAPGYYMAFIYGGFCQSIARSLRRSLRPRFFPSSQAEQKNSPWQWLYIAVSILSVHASLSFAAAAFLVLEFKATLSVWASLNYFGLFFVLILTLGFRLGLGRFLSGRPTPHVVKDPKKRDDLKMPPPATESGMKDEEQKMKREREKNPGGVVPDFDAAEQEVRRRMK